MAVSGLHRGLQAWPGGGNNNQPAPTPDLGRHRRRQHHLHRHDRRHRHRALHHPVLRQPLRHQRPGPAVPRTDHGQGQRHLHGHRADRLARSGQSFTATATDAGNNTSMFSAGVQPIVARRDQHQRHRPRLAPPGDHSTPTPRPDSRRSPSTSPRPTPASTPARGPGPSARPRPCRDHQRGHRSTATRSPARRSTRWPQGDNAVLKIVLDGSAAGSPTDGLDLGGPGGSTVQGFVIDHFSGSGIVVASPGNEILGDFIGIDPRAPRPSPTSAPG